MLGPAVDTPLGSTFDGASVKCQLVKIHDPCNSVASRSPMKVMDRTSRGGGGGI